MKKKGLGRGLDALFGANTNTKKVLEKSVNNKEKREKPIQLEKKEKSVEKISAVENVVELNIIEVEPSLDQPRRVFDEDKISELAESIKEHGVIQPILVKKNKHGYSIIAGERRWRAAKKVGLKKIPAIIKEYGDKKVSEIALVENVQREDLNPIEEARALKEMMLKYSMTQEQVSKVISKNRSTVTNLIRLLNLDPKVQEYILEDKISEGHARCLVGISSPERQIEMANKIIESSLSVRDVEKLIAREKESKVIPKKLKTKKTAVMDEIETKLKDFFGTKVKLDYGKGKGKIVVEYFSNEELDRILEKLNISL